MHINISRATSHGVSQLRACRESRQDQTMHPLQTIWPSSRSMSPQTCKSHPPYMARAALTSDLQCSTCGALDQHETRFCPHNMICRRCGVKGHKAQECQQRGIPYESHCSRCGSSQHPSSTCPKIYKSYRELPKQSQQPKKDFRFACYNCASDRHFGWAH